MKSPISHREFVALSGGVVAGAALTRATSGDESPNHPIPRFDVPLPIPRVLEPIPLAMAERVDVIIDFSRHSVGTNIVLRNLNTRGATGSISNEIMQFHVARVERGGRTIPTRLAESEPLDRRAVRNRQFVFSVRPSFGPLPSPSWRINGQRFDAETPIASPGYGHVEIWRFIDQSFLGVLGIVHPVHVPLVTFKVLQRNGGPPLAHEAGWKDTVAVGSG